MPKQNKPTAKQRRFCEEYLKDLNATQAAIRAGYSKKTAQEIGSENLSKPLVQEYIQKHMNKRSERTQIDADWVLKRLAKLVDVSISDFLVIPADGTMPYYDLRQASPDQLAALEQLQIDTVRMTGEDQGEIIKMKLSLPNKLKNLELIGNHIAVQAFKTQTKLSGSIGLTEVLADIDGTSAGLPNPPEDQE